MKWTRASERLPENMWQGKFRHATDKSLKEYRGIHEQDEGRFSTGSLIIYSRDVEWYDESPESSGKEENWWTSHAKDLTDKAIELLEHNIELYKKENEELKTKLSESSVWPGELTEEILHQPFADYWLSKEEWYFNEADFSMEEMVYHGFQAGATWLQSRTKL